MDAHVQRSKHRASKEQYIAADGHVVERDFQPSDIEILKILARFRFVCAAYLAALHSPARSEQGVSRRLRALKEVGMEYVKICDPQMDDKNLLRMGYLFYDLAPNGIDKLLDDEGIKVRKRYTSKNFVHAVMAEEIAMSFAIGAKDRKDVRIRWFDELLPELPKHTRESKHPLRIPLPRGKNGEYVSGDYPPFAIELPDGKRRYIAKVEADTGRMSLHTSDLDRSGICNKYRHDIELLENEVIQKHFGFKQFYFLYATPSPARLTRMMGYLEEATAHKPLLRRHFIFQVHHSLRSRRPKALVTGTFGKKSEKFVPTGYMLTGAYKRVGYPDIKLDQAGGGGAGQ